MFQNRVSYRFTVEAYDRMIEKGFLTPKDRVELIRGEIVAKMSIGPRHAARVSRLTRLFNRALGDRAIVSPQNPIVLADSEPETDIALLRPRDDFYESRKPEPKDVLLAIEVSDSSIEDDRDVKGPLYAENRIVEYWIVNLDEDCLEVYRSPRANGTYRKKQILHRGDTVQIGALPGVRFAVADLL
jgi:Uma2 family endonuclease